MDHRYASSHLELTILLPGVSLPCITWTGEINQVVYTSSMNQKKHLTATNPTS